MRGTLPSTSNLASRACAGVTDSGAGDGWLLLAERTGSLHRTPGVAVHDPTVAKTIPLPVLTKEAGPSEMPERPQLAIWTSRTA